MAWICTWAQLAWWSDAAWEIKIKISTKSVFFYRYCRDSGDAFDSRIHKRIILLRLAWYGSDSFQIHDWTFSWYPWYNFHANSCNLCLLHRKLGEKFYREEVEHLPTCIACCQFIRSHSYFMPLFNILFGFNSTNGLWQRTELILMVIFQTNINQRLDLRGSLPTLASLQIHEALKYSVRW